MNGCKAQGTQIPGVAMIIGKLYRTKLSIVYSVALPCKTKSINMFPEKMGFLNFEVRLGISNTASDPIIIITKQICRAQNNSLYVCILV